MPSLDEARAIRGRLDELHSVIDRLVMRGGDAVWTGQIVMLRALVDAIAPRANDTAANWPAAAQARLERAWLATAQPVTREIDRSMLSVSRDLAEAANAAGRLGDVPAYAYIEQAAGAWRSGVTGMYSNAQAAISAQVAAMADGAVDLPTATWRAASDMMQRGVHTDQLRDSLGRRWQPATYAETLLRTSGQQAHTAVSLNAAHDTGTPYVVVSDHHRECPRCRPWESKILRIDGVTDDLASATLDGARGEGLMHPNCRHQVHPWWREWDELPAPGQPDAAGYAASQQQRALEREVRQTRLKLDAAKATIGPRSPEARALSAHLKAKRAELAAHVAVWEPRGVLKRNRWREVPRPGDVALDSSIPRAPRPRPRPAPKPTPAAPRGPLDDAPRITAAPAGDAAIEWNRARTNPQNGTDPAYSVNCQRVVMAYELRRRGYDVTARPNPGDDSSRASVFTQWFDGAQQRRLDSGRYIVSKKVKAALNRDYPGSPTALEAITDPVAYVRSVVDSWPVGARGWVDFYRPQGAGHIFNVERTADGARVVEAQVESGSAATLEGYMAQAARSRLARGTLNANYSVFVTRVDDLGFNAGVLEAVTWTGRKL